MKSKYIPSNSICIHLDQFAISDIVQKSNEQWELIGKLLEDGAKKNDFFVHTQVLM